MNAFNSGTLGGACLGNREVDAVHPAGGTPWPSSPPVLLLRGWFRSFESWAGPGREHNPLPRVLCAGRGVGAVGGHAEAGEPSESGRWPSPGPLPGAPSLAVLAGGGCTRPTSSATLRIKGRSCAPISDGPETDGHRRGHRERHRRLPHTSEPRGPVGSAGPPGQSEVPAGPPSLPEPWESSVSVPAGDATLLSPWQQPRVCVRVCVCAHACMCGGQGVCVCVNVCTCECGG